MEVTRPVECARRQAVLAPLWVKLISCHIWGVKFWLLLKFCMDVDHNKRNGKYRLLSSHGDNGDIDYELDEFSHFLS